MIRINSREQTEKKVTHRPCQWRQGGIKVAAVVVQQRHWHKYLIIRTREQSKKKVTHCCLPASGEVASTLPRSSSIVGVVSTNNNDNKKQFGEEWSDEALAAVDALKGVAVVATLK
jgi:hypothetical protein